MLADASNAFLSSKGDLRSLNCKLIALGRTRGSTILAETGVPPCFGLTNMTCMMKLQRAPENQLRLLRTYAARYFAKADPFDVILRYRVQVAFRGVPPPEILGKIDPSTGRDRVMSQKGTTYTASRRSQEQIQDQMSSDSGLGPFPVPVLKIQRVDPGDENDMVEESTIAVDGLDDDVVMGDCTDAPRIETHLLDGKENDPKQAVATNGESMIEYATALPHKLSQPSSDTAPTLYRWMNAGQKFEKLGEEEFAERLICRDVPESFQWLNHRNRKWPVDCDTFRRSATERDFIKRPADPGTNAYSFCLGDPRRAAMFVHESELERCERESGGPNWSRTRRQIKETCDLKDLQAALDTNAVDMAVMLATIAHVAKDSKYFDSLNALAAAYNIYKGFDGATISPTAITKPIFGAKWAQKLNSNMQSCLSSLNRLDRLHVFACIAYFESGGLDMSPSQFDNVMALSSGDSIYVPAWLICDPAERQPAHAVCRLHGNVGKAGLILLVPPADPKTLAPGIDNWKFINRERFDGTVTNTFTGTSLHLSFTDWCIPIDVSEAGRGRRDAEAYIIESLVSVYDRGKWIADLDVLQALSKGCNQPDHEFFYKSFCNHVSAAVVDPMQTFPPIVTITNWDEFLEHPKSPAVAMAHHNWDAKLALAVLGVRRGDRVFVMDRICDTCYTDIGVVGGPECTAKALFLL